MASLLVLLAVTVLCVLWIRGAQRSRVQWLARLALPGRWQWRDHDGALELEGDLDRGRYRFQEPQGEEVGSWSLQGHELVLEPADGRPGTRLDLRLFEDGLIGLDGPGRERRVYVKQRSNVVPLRRQG